MNADSAFAMRRLIRIAAARTGVPEDLRKRVEHEALTTKQSCASAIRQATKTFAQWNSVRGQRA